MIVDVSEVDWSQHPAWSSDFEASEMEVESMDAVPEWAGDPVAMRRVYVCEACGRRMTRREPVQKEGE